MKEAIIVFFIIMGAYFLGLLGGYNLKEETDCLKSQTSMIEINDKKKDFLFCIEPSVYIIKKY